MNTSRINRVLVFSETKGGRVLVGSLMREKGKFIFEYERTYQKLKNAIPLGPEFPLWRGNFKSDALFPSLVDRIPSRRNPAYVDYCRQWGIDPEEDDVFVLLTTIGRRGPSTFVFEPESVAFYGAAEVKTFRERLRLSQREFEALFGISHATLVKLEAGQSKNMQILSYIELCDRVPAACEWLMKSRGLVLRDKKKVAIMGLIEVQKFWQAWVSSPAAQLLIPENTGILFLGKEDFWDASYAFLAFERGLLCRLDELVNHFEILSEGTKQFKGRLRENWLDQPRESEDEKGRRCRQGGQTPAALTELVVAENLECRGYEIVNLEARQNNSSDVIFRKDKRDFYVEVKYFPTSPGWGKALRGEIVRGDSDEKTLNYFFFRIAEAAIQLTSHGVAKRVVWLVFERIVQDVYGGRKTFDEFWKGCDSWYKLDNECPGFPEGAKGSLEKKVLSKSPQKWLKEAGTLVVSTLHNWRLMKIKVISGKLP